MSVVFQAYSTPTLVVRLVDENRKPHNISAATRKDLIYRAPNGEEKRVAMSFETDGVDGSLEYTFSIEETKSPGDYLCQLDAKFGTWDGPTDWFSFSVKPNVISRRV
jgi:hypothetical protein